MMYKSFQKNSILIWCGTGH